MGIGFFRLLLAMTVVITHTHPIFGFTLGNPVIAVRAFFIISGFYMAMILTEKYKLNKIFWENRILKIFPIYWVILLCTILVGFLAHLVNGGWGELAYIAQYLKDFNLFTVISCVFSNIFIITRDIFMYSNFSPNEGLIFYQKDIYNGFIVPAWNFLLIPQAWTLVLELMFYILVPFILLLKNRYIFLIFIASVALKYLMPIWGMTGVIWEYRFFPAEICYFIMGIFAYKFYIKAKIKEYDLKVIGPISISLAIFSLSFFNYTSKYFNSSIFTAEWFFYFLLAILIPVIFAYSKNNSFDRKIGDLSYPVYISHILVNNIVNPLFFVRYVHNPNLQALVVFFCSVILSMAIIFFIQGPIEKIRFKNSEKIKKTNENIKLATQTT